MFNENEVPFPTYIIRVMDDENESHQPCATREYAEKELKKWQAMGFDACMYMKIEKETN